MSVKAATARSAKYLYAVIATPDHLELGDCGLNGQPVSIISYGQLAAVVSDVSGEKILPQRKNLAAHQEVLKQLLNQNLTLLPMAFGVVANSPEAVEDVLVNNAEALQSQLQRVADKVEMGVRVVWDVPNIFEFFVNANPDLLAARDRLFNGDGEAGQDEKLAVGRLFEHLHISQREELTSKVEAVLTNCCAEIKASRCRNEREVMNLVCLVPRTFLPQFEQQVYKAAELFDDNFAFEFNGPWAPYNFVEVALEF